MPYFWCPAYQPTNPNTMTQQEISARLRDNLLQGRVWDDGLRSLGNPIDTCRFGRADNLPLLYTQAPHRDWQETVAAYRERYHDFRCVTHNQPAQIFFRYAPISNRRRQVEDQLFERKLERHPLATEGWRYVSYLVNRRPKPKIFHDIWTTPT
jgi:hypothetical protein